MQRFGQVLRVKPEHRDDYVRYHAEVWPEVLATIKACYITNGGGLGGTSGAPSRRRRRGPGSRPVQGGGGPIRVARASTRRGTLPRAPLSWWTLSQRIRTVANHPLEVALRTTLVPIASRLRGLISLGTPGSVPDRVKWRSARKP